MTAVRYFAYGSNMDHAQLVGRCPSARFLGAAYLRDHRVEFTRYSPNWGGGVADLVAASGGETWGGLFSLATEDLAILDRFEGHPDAYVRRSFDVRTPDATTIAAWAYVVVDKVPATIPTHAYWRALVDGAVACGLPQSYVAWLTAQAHGESI